MHLILHLSHLILWILWVHDLHPLAIKIPTFPNTIRIILSTPSLAVEANAKVSSEPDHATMHSSSDLPTKIPLHSSTHLASKLCFPTVSCPIPRRQSRVSEPQPSSIGFQRARAYMRTRVVAKGSVTSVMLQKHEALPKEQVAYSRSPTNHAA